MRDDFKAFSQRKATIAVVVHDDPKDIAEYWKKHRLPYVGIPDPDGKVAEQYKQEWRLLRGGRMPAMFIIDSKGQLVAEHRGKGMKDIPTNAAVFRVLDSLK